MSLDPYALCPCESGKKLKFCCADIASDMEKALQLHEGGQSKAALKILEKLHEKHPARAWVSTSLAGVHLYLDEPADAREVLKPLLQENPDHPLGRILDATAALDLVGYQEARSTIHRAFTKGVKFHPEMVGSLAAGISSVLYDEDKFVAARQHLAFAMRFVREEDRQQVFMRLLDFDGDQSVPYPLRGVHNLRPLTLDVDEDKVFRKAIGLSSLGCWHEAAKIASQLLEKHEQSAELWYNIGLFHAWDGEQSEAATALHRAALLATDQEFAITCETLAQLFDLEEHRIEEYVQHYSVDSLSQLLTQLDNIPRLRREVSTDPQDPAITYSILDREPAEQTDDSEPTLESCPVVVGVLACVDQPEQHPEAELEHRGSSCHLIVEQESAESVQELLNGLISETLDDSLFQDFDHGMLSQWQDYRGLYRQLYFTPETPARIRAELGRQNWDQFVNDKWMSTALRGLGNKTPTEVSQSDDPPFVLAAAVNVLDSFADRYNIQLNVEAVKQTLKVPASEIYSIVDDQELGSCEVLQMLRIDIGKLNDDQLRILLNRTQLIQHAGFTEKVLGHVIERPQLVDPERMPQLWHAYIDLARDRFDRQEALNRIERAKTWAETSGQKFEDTLQWEMRHLQFLIIDPHDDAIAPFLTQMHQKFLRKLPDLEAIITNYLQEHDITPPWSASSEIVVSNSLSDLGGQGSLQTGTSDAPPAGGKLWLPGQD